MGAIQSRFVLFGTAGDISTFHKDKDPRMVPRESNRLPKLDLEIPGKWKMNAEQRNKFFLLCCSTPEPTHKSTNRLSLGEGMGEKKRLENGSEKATMMPPCLFFATLTA